MTTPTRPVLIFAFMTILIDAMGFGLIMPVLPRLLMRVGEMPLGGTIGLAAWMSLAMFALMALRVPIGVSMGIVGVLGFGALSGLKPALNLLSNVPLSVVTDYNLSVIPMFILMGAFATRSGMSKELFAAGRAWLGHLRGGLAMASIAACGGFAAINGSSVATAATMTQVALPEMRRAGYSGSLSAGLIAAGGTLGIMIPPSVIFVLYGIMTETDISKLFAAGVLPGLLAIFFYFVVVQVIAWRRPELLPRGDAHSWAERFNTLRGLWATILLFAFVLGGIYGGLYTVTEAAGVGAVGTLVIGLLRGRLGPRGIKDALVDTLRVSSAIMTIVIGAYLFGYFLTITQFTQQAVEFLVHLPVGKYGVLALVLVGYFILGAVMDALTAHTAMSKQALESEKLRADMKDVLLGAGKLWEGLREKASGAAPAP